MTSNTTQKLWLEIHTCHWKIRKTVFQRMIYKKTKITDTEEVFKTTYTCFLVTFVFKSHVVIESWKPNRLFLSSYAARFFFFFFLKWNKIEKLKVLFKHTSTHQSLLSSKVWAASTLLIPESKLDYLIVWKKK